LSLNNQNIIIFGKKKTEKKVEKNNKILLNKQTSRFSFPFLSNRKGVPPHVQGNWGGGVVPQHGMNNITNQQH
jgi:hypothetical protein